MFVPARPGQNISNSHLFVVLQVFIRKQETVQTVKLTLRSSGRNPTEPICSCLSIERTKPPTYLFSNQRFQRASETKSTECALTSSARPASSISVVVCVSLPSGPSGAPLVHLCAAGEGVFTVRGRGPQVLFCRMRTFFLPNRDCR